MLPDMSAEKERYSKSLREKGQASGVGAGSKSRDTLRTKAGEYSENALFPLVVKGFKASYFTET